MVCASLLIAWSAGAAEADVRQVLLLQSFDRGTLVLDRFTADFRLHVDRRSTEPVTFTQFVVNPVGFHESPELAILDFLRAAFGGRRPPDLIVTTGGLAATFARKHRAQLFPDVPLLFAAVDQRFLRPPALSTNEAAVAVANNPIGVVADILRLLPDTQYVFVVQGAGALGRFWRQEVERDKASLGNRVQLLWPDEGSYAGILRRASTLPPRSAIFFQSFDVDGRGVTYSTERVLADIRAQANAPLFGALGAELGHGIVGGNLLDTDRLANVAADAAVAILQGTAPAELKIPVLQPGPPIFDWRELQRWGIRADRLPEGSIVHYREPSVWERFRWFIVAGASALIAQTLLISALMVNRVKRRRAEQSLRESEERFRVLANSAPVMIRLSNADGLSADFNVPWLEFTGRSLDQEMGNGWLEGVHPADTAACARTYEEAFQRREPYRMEYRLRRFDGAHRWLLDSGQPRFTPDGSFAGYIGSAIDITELKVARSTLSNLNRRLIKAQEEERSRLARELHDDLCQRMTVLALNLQHVSQAIPEGIGSVRTDLRRLHEEMTVLGHDVNGISHRLHSSKLEVLGLAAAAGSFCKEISTHHGVRIEFKHQDVPQKLPDGVAINLFRVLQEAVSNAVKHSGAEWYRVSLRGIDDEIELEVMDNGRGFDVTGALAASGLGLVSMQERLRLVNGEVFIDSTPGKGTHVRAVAPVRPDLATRRRQSPSIFIKS